MGPEEKFLVTFDLFCSIMGYCLLLIAAFAAVVSAKTEGGICPFKKDLQERAELQGFDAPHYCNVTLLGGNLCACFNSDHCG